MEIIRHTVVPVVIVLLLVVALEIASPRMKVPMRERFPGALYLAALPVMVIGVSWPLRTVWARLGIEPLFSVRSLHPAVGFIAALLILDFFRYWEHRTEHRWWWRVHSLHHSQSSVHAASVYAHPLIAIPEFFVIAIPLSFIDIGVAGFFFLGLAVIFQDFVIHSPLRVHFGPLRRVFVDNRFHRIHHSLEERHFGKNFGLMFTLWDQLFGTAYFPASDEWPATGVEGMKSPRTIGDILLHPLMAGRNLPAAVGQFGPAQHAVDQQEAAQLASKIDACVGSATKCPEATAGA